MKCLCFTYLPWVFLGEVKEWDDTGILTVINHEMQQSRCNADLQCSYAAEKKKKAGWISIYNPNVIWVLYYSMESRIQCIHRGQQDPSLTITVLMYFPCTKSSLEFLKLKVEILLICGVQTEFKILPLFKYQSSQQKKSYQFNCTLPERIRFKISSIQCYTFNTKLF